MQRIQFNILLKFFTVIFLIVLTAFLASVGVSIQLTHALKDGTIINISGQQRMLSQKIIKELLIGDNDELAKSFSLFHESHAELKSASKIRINKQENDTEIMEQMLLVDSILQSFSEKGLVVLNSPPDSEEYKIARAHLLQNNLNLLHELDKAVDIFEKHSQDDITRIKSHIWLGFLFIILMALLCFYFVRRKITQPLNDLTNTVIDIAQGKLSSRTHISSNDEIGILSKNINIMADSLKTMITQVKDSACEVMAREEQIKLLMNSTAEGICGLDPNCRCTFANQASVQMLGYANADDLVGKDLHTLIHSPPGEETLHPKDDCEIFFACQQGEKIHVDNEVFWKADGTSFPVAYSSHPLEDDGSINGCVVTFHDITERKLSEKALLESRVLHEEAQKIAQIGHWRHEFASQSLFWSDEIYRIFKLDKEQFNVSHENFLKFVHPDDRDSLDQAYKDSLSSRTGYDIVHRIICGDGSIKHLHERCRNEFDENGKPLRSIGTVQDITALQEAELEKEKVGSRLRQAQKMEAIGTLAGGIAHDFNNLLNAILGYSSLLQRELPNTSRQYNHILEIHKAGKRAAELVKQILTFSRRTEEARQPIQLQFIVKEVMKLLKSSLPTTVEIRQDIGDCGHVIADSTQIHQIIMNLCTNAFHAMRDAKGVLEVRLEEVDVGQNLVSQIENLSEGRYVCLTVSDTGAGIDKITMDRIFEPYFTTKKKGEGTGLGLATVHGIIEKYGGAISVQSEKGQGTTFTIYFPIANLDIIQAKDNEAEQELPKLDARILFIDDVEFNVQLGIELCKLLGCSTRGVTNSLEALALFRKAPEDYDIVITDQTMPNLTGFELAIEMFKIRSDIPIIMLTGHSDIVDEQKAKEIEISDFLSKPLDINILAEAVSKALS